jgi:hypothetical protein
VIVKPFWSGAEQKLETARANMQRYEEEVGSEYVIPDILALVMMFWGMSTEMLEGGQSQRSNWGSSRCGLGNIGFRDVQQQQLYVSEKTRLEED